MKKEMNEMEMKQKKLVEIEFEAKNIRTTYYLEANMVKFHYTQDGEVKKVVLEVRNQKELADLLALAENLAVDAKGGIVTEIFEDGTRKNLELNEFGSIARVWK